MTCRDAVSWYMRASVLRSVADRLAVPKPEGTLVDALTAMENRGEFELHVDEGAFTALWTTGRKERR